MRGINLSKQELLIKAVESGDFKSAQKAIAEGENINSKNHLNESLLFIAAEKGHTEIALFLIDKMADIHILNNGSQSALHAACRSGDLEIVKALLKSGAKVNQANSRGILPIAIAVKYNHPHIIDYFFKNSLLISEELFNSIHIDSNINLKTIKILCSIIPHDLSAQERIFGSLISGSHIDGIEYVLKTFSQLRPKLFLYFNEILKNFSLAGKDVTPEARNTILKKYIKEMWFNKVEKNEVLSYLLNNGLAQDDLDMNGQTIFHVACSFVQDEYQEVMMITGLLMHGYFIDIKNAKSQTPLQVAIESGLFFHAVYLILCGANIKTQDMNGKSPLDYAHSFQLHDNKGNTILDELDIEYRDALIQLLR